jgi:hypothetical protein
VAAFAAVTLAGAAAAAITGALPAQFQGVAHSLMGAPPDGPRQAGGAHPAPEGTHAGRKGVSPASLGPSPDSLAGLCVAYEHARSARREAGRPVAFQRLVRAAGSADRVAAFCAVLSRPVAGPRPGAGPPTSGPGLHRHGAHRGHRARHAAVGGARKLASRLQVPDTATPARRH